jgi:hypothetical protein
VKQECVIRVVLTVGTGWLHFFCRHFCSRKAMDIKGVGPAAAEYLHKVRTATSAITFPTRARPIHMYSCIRAIIMRCMSVCCAWLRAERVGKSSGRSVHSAAKDVLRCARISNIYTYQIHCNILSNICIMSNYTFCIVWLLVRFSEIIGCRYFGRCGHGQGVGRAVYAKPPVSHRG